MSGNIFPYFIDRHAPAHAIIEHNVLSLTLWYVELALEHWEKLIFLSNTTSNLIFGFRRIWVTLIFWITRYPTVRLPQFKHHCEDPATTSMQEKMNREFKSKWFHNGRKQFLPPIRETLVDPADIIWSSWTPVDLCWCNLIPQSSQRPCLTTLDVSITLDLACCFFVGWALARWTASYVAWQHVAV